ncbi:hypothetical protein P691DRAFT_148967 [Macrolepiota fuliginosa MF-IS2]|uniref:Arrestin-like N-terminal domain-containing protein n=1 Tax=Macrolepiota fuliginosa MF-IS2 TaxID=1400762 RepID=A0A9P6C945_9AGAR|nr:hypothetical protein P691DRAFT_148967 [Macrolepiota fuliginosa MF-IS2]
MEEDMPPPYEVDETQPLPTYSCNVSSSECLLQIEPPRMTNCPACDWMFETKQMRINLGPRLWNLHSPSYGLNGRIEGTIRLSGDHDRIESVTMTLEGRIRITGSQRTAMSADTVTTLVSRTMTIYDCTEADSFSFDEDHAFSLTIPQNAEIKGQLTKLPPSHFSDNQLFSSEVFYTVKFELKRKGMGLKKHESKVVRVLYFPKSTPTEPPMHTIPRPSRRQRDTELYRLYDRVKTASLTPYHPIVGKSKPKRSTSSLDNFGQCAFLSLPHPQCYASGQIIPFTLSLVFPDDPALGQLLTRSIRIQLLRRVSVWKRGSDLMQRDTLVSVATLRYGREYREGIIFLKGEVQAGDPGKEVSWALDGVAEVQYVLRVTLKPPTNLIGSIPCFKHEEVLKLTTDSWGILDRELSSTGGTPTPAIGLATGIRRSE